MVNEFVSCFLLKHRHILRSILTMQCRFLSLGMEILKARGSHYNLGLLYVFTVHLQLLELGDACFISEAMKWYCHSNQNILSYIVMHASSAHHHNEIGISVGVFIDFFKPSRRTVPVSKFKSNRIAHNNWGVSDGNNVMA